MIHALFFALSLSVTTQDTLKAHSHLQLLSHDQLAGRKTGTLHASIAADYIAKQFQNAELNPVFANYKVPFRFSSGFFGEKEAHNVLAASEQIANRPTVVISAHFDHLGTKGRHIYNGADDNASGVAALITLASLIAKQPNRKLNYLFLATDAEESGLFGAREFIKASPVPLSNVLININLDMLGVSKRNKLLGLYNAPSKAFIESLRTNIWHKDSEVKFTRGNGFYNRTIKNQRRRILDAGDHREFHRKRIAILYFGVGEHSNYHSQHDTYENLDHAFFDGSLHNIAKVISQLDANYQLLSRH